MPLSVGTNLGAFEIVGAIGAGGMGEVYRARDTKLGRDVAIKVLPETFSQDHERLARFAREAKLLAALNHKGIASLYGFEEADGKPYLVMELVEGETLAERIAKGPIAVDEAVALFVQIAEALEFAHEKGIVHRDLKPANIKISRDDEIKILDFGLAKAYAEEQEPFDDGSQSPTLTKGTALGAIMGTASYMSPEQARGKTVDRRADIWAFGCCLYEALTGAKAFVGETVTDTLAEVVKNEPDWARLPGDTPAALRALLKRCLRKDPKRRQRDMGDVRIELEEPTAASGGAPKPSWPAAPWVAASLLAVLAAWLVFPPSAPPLPLRRFVIQLPEGARFSGGPERQIDISGNHIVYSADSDNAALYLQELDAFTPVEVANTEGAWNPFFSPDGEWIGFFADGRLFKVSLAGSTPVPICDALPSPGASWGEDGTIVFADGFSSGLRRVAADGGKPEVLTEPDREAGETGHRWPQILPGGDAVLFTVRTQAGSRIVVQSLDSGERKILVEENMGATEGRYVGTGHLLYDLDESVIAAPFDVDTLTLTGAPTSVVQDLFTANGGGLTRTAVSAAGHLVYLPASATRGTSSVQVLSADRRWIAESALKDDYRSLALSPDGGRLAVTIGRSGRLGIWIYDMARESLVPLALGGRTNYTPIWTSDGARVTFASGRDGHTPNPYWVAADGSDEEVPILEDMAVTHEPSSWSPDGEVLAYGESGDILMWRRDGTSTSFTSTPFTESLARFSPDGRRITYVSDESGTDEVYVTSYPTPGAKVSISTDGGTNPKWAPDGRALFFLNRGQIWRVSVSRDETFVAGVPELVVEGTVIDYDVFPDGERVIAIRPEGSGGFNRLHLVLNWDQELARLAPTE